MNQNSGVNFQNFSEKKTTSPGSTKPKCLEVSYQEFSLYLIFLPECLVKWFAFQKFPQFSYCLKTFPGHNLHTICPFLENFQNFPSSGNYPKSNLLTDLQTYKLSKYTITLQCYTCHSYSCFLSHLQMFITIRVIRKLGNGDVFIHGIWKQLYYQVCQVIKCFWEKQNVYDC